MYTETNCGVVQILLYTQPSCCPDCKFYHYHNNSMIKIVVGFCFPRHIPVLLLGGEERRSAHNPYTGVLEPLLSRKSNECLLRKQHQLFHTGSYLRLFTIPILSNVKFTLLKWVFYSIGGILFGRTR